MKIALLGNQARAMSNFWSVLIGRLVGTGHEAVCLLPTPSPGDDPAWEASLTRLGARVLHYPLDRKGLNPFRDIATFRALHAFFRDERPDVLFAYTIKPVIYGALAAARAGSPPAARRNLMITGLGYMFEADSPGKRLLRNLARLLYHAALACSGTVFFQNREDREVFESLSIIPRSITVVQCKGTGVDTRRFAAAPPPGGPPVFLFVGRLLEAKGLRDFAEAARRVRRAHPEAVFRILGPAEKGLGSVPLEEVLAWEQAGDIEYLGEALDVRPYIAAATAVVLPSWREGAPVSLLEAMSMGRAVVAADAPGSREVVRDGHNGLLTPLRDPAALAAALGRLVDAPGLAAAMGAAGRELAEREYSAENVARQLMLDMGVTEKNAS